MTKEKLLKELNGMISLEEGMVTLYANFSKVLAAHVEGLEGNRKKEINKLLSILYRDSSRHREIIENIIKDAKNRSEHEY